MAEKRVLPARTSRGRRPQQTEEEKAHDDAIYQQLFQRANDEARESPKKEKQRQKIQQRFESSQLQLQFKLMSSHNRVFFPYSRSYHYYFDLTNFPRLENSFSYAVDEDNVFNFTYSQEDKVIREGLTVGELFNRKYFGLPICDTHNQATKDKNICHGYLFQNEDRKFQLDRCLEELKQILKNFQKLEQNKTINNFSCLKKDIDLTAILEDQVSIEEKKNILRKRIKILAEKKESMKNFVLLEDKNFYYHSLNQKLHNKIEKKLRELTYQFITSQMECHDHWRNKLRDREESEKKSTLAKLFIYFETQNEKFCLSEETLSKMSRLIGRNFFFKDSNEEFYDISCPFTFLSFNNNSIMTVCEKVLALRLAYQSEASFYICKIFWKKAFGRDLTINKEMKQLSRVDYEKAMSTSILQLQKWRKQQKNAPQPLVFPHLDNLVKWETLNENSKCFDLFPMEKSIEINVREYICLMLYQHLYLCIAEIYQFILNNQVFCELIASQFYGKAHNYVVETIGTWRIGILDDVLKKFTEWMIRADIETAFKLKWVYNQELKVAYVVKTSQEPEWETEKEEEEDQEVKDQPLQKKIK